MNTYTHYFQAEPPPGWGGRLLHREKTIKQAGCLLCCLAMRLRGEEGSRLKHTDPAVLDDYLDHHNGYSGDMIEWEAVFGYSKTVGLDWKSEAKVAFKWDHLEVHQQNPAEILEVMHNKSTHFILVIWTASGALVLDPGHALPGGQYRLTSNELRSRDYVPMNWRIVR